MMMSKRKEKPFADLCRRALAYAEAKNPNYALNLTLDTLAMGVHVGKAIDAFMEENADKCRAHLVTVGVCALWIHKNLPHLYRPDDLVAEAQKQTERLHWQQWTVEELLLILMSEAGELSRDVRRMREVKEDYEPRVYGSVSNRLVSVMDFAGRAYNALGLARQAVTTDN